MNRIVSSVLRLIESIETGGMEVGNTLERFGPELLFDNVMINDYPSLYRECENLLGGKFVEKVMYEMPHYKYLEYAVKAKILYNDFYFKESPINSRKLVVHSDDCISNLIFMPREDRVFVHALIRSSDVVNLLLPDIWGILHVVHNVMPVLYDISIFKVIPVDLIVKICSAHIYPKNDPRRKK